MWRVTLVLVLNLALVAPVLAQEGPAPPAGEAGAAGEAVPDSAPAAGAPAAVVPAAAAGLTAAPQDWQEEFGVADRPLSPTGQARYFVLVPGYQLELASRNAKLTITVLDEVREIGGITTRVVEEREEVNGQLYEVARNFFAIDQQTGDVFYFGEDVDFYREGTVVAHSGSWTAYEGGNKPGLIMPGTPAVGMKYYQEVAPGVAMDRAEVISPTETCKTPAGDFQDCLITRESSAIEAVIESKSYAPGIGLVQDQGLSLVRYGYTGPGR